MNALAPCAFSKFCCFKTKHCELRFLLDLAHTAPKVTEKLQKARLWAERERRAAVLLFTSKTCAMFCLAIDWRGLEFLKAAIGVALVSVLLRKLCRGLTLKRVALQTKSNTFNSSTSSK